MGESKFFSNFLSGYITPGASLGPYMSMHTNYRQFWAHLRHLILGGKLENFFFSLIMGFIMGESEFFSKFLSGLSHQQRPRALS